MSFVSAIILTDEGALLVALYVLRAVLREAVLVKVARLHRVAIWVPSGPHRRCSQSAGIFFVCTILALVQEKLL